MKISHFPHPVARIYIMNEEIRVSLKTSFSEYELKKIKYFYLCLLYEGSKFLLMLLFFSCVHLQREYLVAIVVLLSIRGFSGGIHLQTYTGCLIFSFAFMLSSILCSQTITLSNTTQNAILALCILLMLFVGPVTSSNRPALTQKQNMIYRCITCSVLLFYLILFIAAKTFPYRNICFWVIVFQISQLVAAKILKKGEKR